MGAPPNGHKFSAHDGSASRAGKRSVEKKREKRTLRDVANLILQADAPLPADKKRELASMLGVKSDEITFSVLSTFAQAQKAAKGDLPALVYLRDTAGQKPVENVNVNTPDQTVMEQIRKRMEDISDT